MEDVVINICGYEVIISACDVESIKDLKWRLHKGSKNQYFVRNGPRPQKRAILLHRFIVGEPKGKAVVHINGNTFDNRRENLRICAYSEIIRYIKTPPKTGYEKSTRLYQTYRDMIRRCYEKKNRAYKWYGQKGIRICDEWKNSYKNFVDWALSNGYSDSLTIDRIDSNENYTPKNCRWISLGENSFRAHVGKPLPKSDELRRSLSRAMKGKMFGDTRAVMCIDTGKSFTSLTKASSDTGASISSICLAAKGKYKTAGGLRWQYVL